MYSLKLLVMLLFLIGGSCAQNMDRSTSNTLKVTATPAVSQQSHSRIPEVVEPPPAPAQSERASKSLIRAIDFKNFTYPWYPEGYIPPYKGRKVTLQNGEIRVNAIPSKKVENVWLTLDNISYVDLTGDDRDEAIVTVGGVTTFNSGSACIFIYAMIGGMPKLLWHHETGDRAYGGLRSIRTENRDLIVEQYDSKFGEEETPMCCPKKFIRTYYRWDRKHFQKLKSETLPNEYENARFTGYINSTP